MNFRFHILDRNNVSTEVDEPVGFDALTCEIGRDANWHGIFFTNSGENFEYYGPAYQLLKDEYQLWGAQGEMTLIMEQECAGVWTEFERGKFVFSKYDPYPDDCYIKCPLEAVGEIMDLRNRVDQKVNLESLKAFDEITDLVAYDKLSFDIDLPSKGIFMQNKAEWTLEETTSVNLGEVPTIKLAGGSDILTRVNYAWFDIIPQFDKSDLSELGTFITSATPEHHFLKSGWYDPRPDTGLEMVIPGNTISDRQIIYFDWATASALLFNDGNANNFDAVRSFSLDINYSFDLNTTASCSIVSLYKILVIRRKDGSYEYLNKDRIFSGSAGSGQGGYDTITIYGPSSSHNINFTASYSTLILNDGDYLFVAVCGLAMYKGLDAADTKPDAYDIVSKGGSVNMETLTHTAYTKAKFFAVNECLSRISESITNDKLRGYSEYFGRTDSQPYALLADGCGSLEAITNGLRIRGQENKTPGQTDVFSVSLQDMFDGLCPIHNIGMGIEADTNRAGYNRLRVEPWTFFYNDTLVMSCTGIDKINQPANDKEIFSTFQFGYDKWEAEEYNGLDEFLTKRNYRTSLSQVKNDLTKLSKFIASGYALEVTRRKGNADTKDWRYDNDVFIICLSRTRLNKFSAVFTGDHAFTFWQNTMVVDYIDDPAPLNVTSVTVAGTLFNNGTFAVTFVTFSNGKATFHFAPGTLTDEICDTVTFPDIVFPSGIFAELGNVTTPVNIVDPDTLYNYRISPVRNAMRWMNKILASYRQFNTDAKIIFTDGDGNYFAQGEMTDTSCRLENAALTENQTINSSVFADALNARPVAFPERVIYTYPFTAQDYVNIKANPGGKIYFESAKGSGYGWIDTIKWNPNEGTADFNLIPKFTN